MRGFIGLAGITACFITGALILATNKCKISSEKNTNKSKSYIVPTFKVSDSENHVITTLLETAPNDRVFILKYADYLEKKFGNKILIDAIYLKFISENGIVSDTELFEETTNYYKLYEHDEAIVGKFGEKGASRIYLGVINLLGVKANMNSDRYDCYISLYEAAMLEKIIPDLENRVQFEWSIEDYDTCFKILYVLLSEYRGIDTDKYVAEVNKLHDIITCDTDKLLNENEIKLSGLSQSNPNYFADLYRMFDSINNGSKCEPLSSLNMSDE